MKLCTVNGEKKTLNNLYEGGTRSSVLLESQCKTVQSSPTLELANQIAIHTTNALRPNPPSISLFANCRPALPVSDRSVTSLAYDQFHWSPSGLNQVAELQTLTAPLPYVKLCQVNAAQDVIEARHSVSKWLRAECSMLEEEDRDVLRGLGGGRMKYEGGNNSVPLSFSGTLIYWPMHSHGAQSLKHLIRKMVQDNSGSSNNVNKHESNLLHSHLVSTGYNLVTERYTSQQTRHLKPQQIRPCPGTHPWAQRSAFTHTSLDNSAPTDSLFVLRTYNYAHGEFISHTNKIRLPT
ncbi:hypothetical protein CBL_13649 [Carabus blaptoides fortunei]